METMNDASVRGAVKKPYQPPKLIVLWHLTQLTLTTMAGMGQA